MDGSSLHVYMQRVDPEGWGIVILEYVQERWWAGVRERHWWFTLKQWAVIDVPPGIPREGAERQNHWLNQRLLKEMKQAQHDANHARAKAMRAELSDLAAELHIPLVHGATMLVPNVTPTQKTAILRVMRYILRSTTHWAWEKHAIKKVM